MIFRKRFANKQLHEQLAGRQAEQKPPSLLLLAACTVVTHVGMQMAKERQQFSRRARFQKHHL
jgi:hypothetical protein